MFWLGIIIGLCLATIGFNNDLKKKVNKAKDLDELKKML